MDFNLDIKGLTFGLSDGGRRGDGAEGGAAWEGGVSPGHSDRMTHPRCRVDWSDWFICTGREKCEESVTDTQTQRLGGVETNAYTYCEAE